MSKWLRREKARECPVHSALLEAAYDELNQHGVFSKEEVLELTGYSSVSDSVRWDYIVEWLREEFRVELIPVREALFKRHSKEKLKRMPEKYIAQGYGARTAGWASVDWAGNAPIVVKRLEQRAKMVNGTKERFEDYIDNIRKCGGELPYSEFKQIEQQEQHLLASQ